MINIYLITHYADRDYIQYRGDSFDVDAIRQLGFESKAEKRYDINYTALAKEHNRGEPLKRLEEYLRRNYQTPEIRLSLFPGSNSLPDNHSLEDWKVMIGAAITRRLIDSGVRVIGKQVIRNGNRFPVIGKQAILREPQYFEEVEANEVIEYRLWIDPSRRPWLLTNFDCSLTLNGKSIDPEQVALRYPGNVQIRRALKNFTTRSTQEQFAQMSEFVSHIRRLEIAGGLSFSSKPTSASEAGFSTWYWLVDTNSALKLGRGFESNFAQALEGDSIGLQSVPANLQVVLLHPSDLTERRLCCVRHWRLQTNDLLNKNLKAFVTDYPVRVETIAYQLDDIEEAVTSYRHLVKNYSRLLVLFFIPPDSARNSHDPAWQNADAKTKSLRDQLLQVSQRPWIETLDWTLAYDRKKLEPAFKNALLKGLFIVGSQHWTVARIPLDGRHPDEVAFIGLDAAPKPHRLAGTIFDSQGIFGGYQLVLCEGEGEIASSDELRRVIEQLLRHYEQKFCRIPRHLIVHRDGLLKEDLKGFKAIARKCGFTFDLVEVTKSGAPHIYQAGNDSGTPSAGIAVAREDLAYLVNLHSIEEQGKLPAPNALRVQKIEGSTSLKTLAAQIFWLSRLDINSYHRSANLPVTTAYAHALAKKKKPGEGNFPYFL